jgi:hypothetical protein
MRGKPLWSAVALGAAVLLAWPDAGHAAKYKPKYKAAAVKDGGTIAGKVIFKGALPEDAVEKILITKNPDVCGKGEREVVWIDVEDGALRGAFVFIDDIKQGKKWGKPEGGNYMVEQKGCRFRPWAQVVKPGTLVVRNSDKGVAHNMLTRNVFFDRKGRRKQLTLFNFQQPDPGDIDKKLRPKRSPYIAMNCEVHNFMFGFMMAPVHPYAAVVGEDGSYSLDGVPPGDYTVKAWHPRLGFRKTKVSVPAGGSVQADFGFGQ